MSLMKVIGLTAILFASGIFHFTAYGALNPRNGIMDICFSPHGNCDQKIIKFVDSATKTIDMAIYSISLQGLVDSIIRLKKSGVKIRMVVDKLQAHGRSSAVSHLAKAGIPIKYGNVSGIMHNKFTIIDGNLVETGSYNYSSNATSYNAENQIYLNEPAVIQEFASQFEDLWDNGLAIDK